MKSETEIRERIKFWEEAINTFKENNPDLPKSMLTPLIVMAGKQFALRWVLDEGEDI